MLIIIHTFLNNSNNKIPLASNMRVLCFTFRNQFDCLKELKMEADIDIPSVRL